MTTAELNVVVLVGAAVLPGRYQSRLDVNSSLQDVCRLLRQRGATRVDLDHYWPSAEFYLGPQTVHYLYDLDGLPPGEVAALTGFYDQAHLTRHFRKLVGVPPGRYRSGARRIS